MQRRFSADAATAHTAIENGDADTDVVLLFVDSAGHSLSFLVTAHEGAPVAADSVL